MAGLTQAQKDALRDLAQAHPRAVKVSHRIAVALKRVGYADEHQPGSDWLTINRVGLIIAARMSER